MKLLVLIIALLVLGIEQSCKQSGDAILWMD